MFRRRRSEMASHTLDVLRQGIWASLTGGWFYDPRQGIFCNTFHMYVWLLLLTVPFMLHLSLPSSLIVWAIYCSCIALIFMCIKVLSYVLHHMFDTGQLQEVVPTEDEHSDSDSSGRNRRNEAKDKNKVESIELTTINESSVTPPVRSSSRMSLTEPANTQAAPGEPTATNTKSVRLVAYTRTKESDSNMDNETAEFSSTDRMSAGTTLVTTADVNQAPFDPPSAGAWLDGSSAVLHEDSDSDLSMGQTPVSRIPRRCNAIRRNKSNFESSSASLSKSAGVMATVTPARTTLPKRTRASSLSTNELETDASKASKIARKGLEKCKKALSQECENDLIDTMGDVDRRQQAHRSDDIGSRKPGSMSLEKLKLNAESHAISVPDRMSHSDQPALMHAVKESALHIVARHEQSVRALFRVPQSSSASEVSVGEAGPTCVGSSDAGLKVLFETTVDDSKDKSNGSAGKNGRNGEAGAGKTGRNGERGTGKNGRNGKDGTEKNGRNIEDDTGKSGRNGEGGAENGLDPADIVGDVENCNLNNEIDVGMLSKSERDLSTSDMFNNLLRTEDANSCDLAPPSLMVKSLPITPNIRAESNRVNLYHSADPLSNAKLKLPRHSRHSSQQLARSDADRKILDFSLLKIPKLLRLTMDNKAESQSSKQSSVVGLDWLFSTDSDTGSSGGSHYRSDSVGSSSTASIDDVFKQQKETTVTPQIHAGPDMPATEVDKSQGAIPKRPLKMYPIKYLSEEDVVEAEDNEDTWSIGEVDTKQTSSPASELSDPEDFLLTIIEIMNDPTELKKLKAAVSAKRHRERASDGEKRDPRPDESHMVSNDDKGDVVKVMAPMEECSLLPEAQRRDSRDVRYRRRKNLRGLSRRPPTPKARDRLHPMTPAGHIHHLAHDHDDTSEGAVHQFRDEDDNVITYMFSTTGNQPTELDTSWKAAEKWETSSSAGSGSTVVVDAPPKASTHPPQHITPMHPRLDLTPQAADFFPRPCSISQFVDSIITERVRRTQLASESYSDSDVAGHTMTAAHKEDKPKRFYKLSLLDRCEVKLRFDRLALTALLDRNLSVMESCIAVTLAVAVSVMGASILSQHIYTDFCIFIFCFVIASSQYSLLKSVQPDAASPMHGVNRIIAFSRPFYMCLSSASLLVLHHASSIAPHTTVYVYGLPLATHDTLVYARDIMYVFILCLPLMFTLGLLPQVNTFAMYALEQIDMHIFGANAATGLGAAVYSIIRSIVFLPFLYAFCYLAMQEDKKSQHVLFSIFSGLVVAVSYHLSRSATDPSVLWSLIVCRMKGEPKDEAECTDPLPAKLRKSVSERIQSDLLACFMFVIVHFAVHVSTVYSSTALQPNLTDVLCYLVTAVGFILHYLMPQFRKEMPWLCCAHPILQSYERSYLIFEPKGPAKIVWFEKAHVWLCFIERNVLYPVVFICIITTSAPQIIDRFGVYVGPALVVLCGVKIMRSSFSDPSRHYQILIFSTLFFKYDCQRLIAGDYTQAGTESMLIDYFVVAILHQKFVDLVLKMHFILTYITPWQITWGSAFHAVAQPFSVPHSAMLFVQTAISAIASTPLNPFLGSAIFTTSYVRPVKFWEKDYNTKRVDHTNTRLSSQLENNPGTDDNNLNSIFYEHLTRSLQDSLCGDLAMGRWGPVSQGDFFFMVSDSLTALVHVIELGNGLVSYQLRGLEFRGTYCQQREVEAITEGVEDDDGFCCLSPGHLPHCLSMNALFHQRWLSWEVVVTKYILDGYSISDNSAAIMLQVYDLRKLLVTFYIKSIIYYTLKADILAAWLQNPVIIEALTPLCDKSYVDLDPTFNVHVDEDFDRRLCGVSVARFLAVYFPWIEYCAMRRQVEKCCDDRRKPETLDHSKGSLLVALCYGLSLLGRRALAVASYNNTSAKVDLFLHGLHTLFKGDFRVISTRDEWVFTDVEMLRRVVSPSVRMSLKLHQDNFTTLDEYDDPSLLFNAIESYEENLVISHEADPEWRNAVLANKPSLLALRHVQDDGTDEYKIIMLNRRHLNFRVVKVNRECVKGLWAGQQQELIFLRNRNPERGSIQNAKQALRNMINSSCDQPIGYPIYVSPLTTSYSSSHDQLASVIGREITLHRVTSVFTNLWRRMREHCGASCVSSGSMYADATFSACSHTSAAAALGSLQGVTGTATCHRPSPEIPLQTMLHCGSRASMSSGNSRTNPQALKPALSVHPQPATKDALRHRVRIMDVKQIYDGINLGRRIDVQWPCEEWRQNGGKNVWQGWWPRRGMVGYVVHRWVPCHREVGSRSHIDRTIVLVQIGDKYVPVAESGLIDLGAEV